MLLKQLYHRIIPHKLQKIIHNCIYSDYDFKKCKFKIHKYGKLNPNLTFFVINDSNPYAGLLSEWFEFMAAVNYAEQKQLIPVIDLQNYYMNTICDKTDIGRKNAWDFYFEQPNHKYLLEEIYQSKKVIICPTVWTEGLADYSIRKGNKDILTELSEQQKNLYSFFYNKCPLKNEILNKAQNLYKLLFPHQKRILGVSFRRAYERHHYWNDPITPEGTHLVKDTLKTIIPKIEKILQDDRYDFFFLLCDDREANEEIKKNFNKQCITFERPLPHYFEGGIPIPVDYKDDYDLIFKEFSNTPGAVTQRNIDYLIAIYLLSRCTSLLNAGGTADLFAYIINNYSFEKIY